MPVQAVWIPPDRRGLEGAGQRAQSCVARAGDSFGAARACGWPGKAMRRGSLRAAVHPRPRPDDGGHTGGRVVDFRTQDSKEERSAGRPG